MPRSGGTGQGCALVAAQMFVLVLLGLAVDAQTGDRTGLETGDGDLFAAFVANTVGAVVDALQRGLDLADQAAFAVTDAQGEGAVGFSGSPVSRVGKDFVAVRELFDGGVALLLGFLQHAGEELAEILYILLVHISLPTLAL